MLISLAALSWFCSLGRVRRWNSDTYIADWTAQASVSARAWLSAAAGAKASHTWYRRSRTSRVPAEVVEVAIGSGRHRGHEASDSAPIALYAAVVRSGCNRGAFVLS